MKCQSTKILHENLSNAFLSQIVEKNIVPFFFAIFFLVCFVFFVMEWRFLGAMSIFSQFSCFYPR